MSSSRRDACGIGHRKQGQGQDMQDMGRNERLQSWRAKTMAAEDARMD